MQSANEFLKSGQYFHLGHLTTETPHPLTMNLSELARTNLTAAIQCLLDVDTQALNLFLSKVNLLQEMFTDIQNTFKNKHRVFLCGCGATGRLSISLEFLWRQAYPNNESVISFMAGGDVALVSAIENFEDYPDYGARQLTELGFQEGDLLISSTEAGETPFVIGATLKASQISKNKPWFLYCNPDTELMTIERSKNVLENAAIKKRSFCVGPMAITGSTRMQASTVLMLAIGLCLLSEPLQWKSQVNILLSLLKNIPRLPLRDLIYKESQIYLQQDHTIYCSDEYAITVFTDTTERAPTFSLPSFDHPNFSHPKNSFTYISVPSTHNSHDAWIKLFGHTPRVLNWQDINVKTTSEFMSGFDFSKNAILFRHQLIPHTKHFIINVFNEQNLIKIELDTVKFELQRTNHILFDHLLLKIILNIHSTLVMGLLGRYEGNLMTYVKPTNGKLIDRATRYIQILLERNHIKMKYEKIVEYLFAEIPKISADEPIVMKVYNKITSNH